MKLIPILLTMLVLASCAGEKKESSEDNTKSQKQSAALYVDTLRLARQTFSKQIVCNGKLRAELKSDIQAKSSGILSSIKVKSGDNVAKGALLASLERENADIELAKAKRSMEKAELDLTDRLIGQGYGLDSVEVPEAVLRNAKHTSGYNTAEDNLAAAERAVADCYIYAPFSGRIANLDAKVYDMSEDVLCTLINDNTFDVEFNILEAELSEVAKGQKVEVSPFIDENKLFSGYITEINPLIDDKGQVKVRAKISNKSHQLIEGMNVKITLNRQIENQFVVPKDAVVLRDGYNVIFRYEDGEAVWTYVSIVMSNINSHLITGHQEKGTELTEDDIIITSGTRNLADGVRVNAK